ncbi:hypothetical protein [Streptomyces sp. NBRC 110028]|uniref:hypothetical protein n=1 Tax=Streptomyces sp. NBRC 110028 TaxID=1621260 RepID=UPI0006E1B650|nr:hypothetical protein [Streptomyces sp. NBRC 110028]
MRLISLVPGILYVVASCGTFAHRAAALRRDAIIGWTITRSAFQRRAGLLTLGDRLLNEPRDRRS